MSGGCGVVPGQIYLLHIQAISTESSSTRSLNEEQQVSRSPFRANSLCIDLEAGSAHARRTLPFVSSMQLHTHVHVELVKMRCSVALVL